MDETKQAATVYVKAMQRWYACVVACVIMGAVCGCPVTPESTVPAYASQAELAQNWHRFRGIGGAGVTGLTTIPTQWDGASGEGILWKTEVPRRGHSSPVVWKDKVFLSGGTTDGLQVYCFDAQQGKLLWTGSVPTEADQLEDLEVMEDTGLAACTVATDGARVYAIFASGDLICFDLAGKQLWHHPLGVPESVYGYATSLEVYRDRVLVQFDQAYDDEGKSFMAAYEGPTGKLVWKTERPVSNGWTSPIIAKVGEREQLITVGAPLVIGYDPETGRELWRAECVEGDVAPSPVVAEGMVFAIEPYSQMLAIRLDGQGDVTETHIAWRNEDGGPDICSPVTASGLIYLLDSQGELACFKVTDGSELFRYDLDEMFNASPSIVGDTLYLLDAEGTMHMTAVRPEPPQEVKTASLGEKCFASPAFVEGRIYIRGEKHLWCIGKSGNQ